MVARHDSRLSATKTTLGSVRRCLLSRSRFAGVPPPPPPRFPPDASALHRIESVVSTAPPTAHERRRQGPGPTGREALREPSEKRRSLLVFLFRVVVIAVRARGAGKVNRHGRRGESRAAHARGAGGEDRRLGARRGGLVAVHDEILDVAEFAHGSERGHGGRVVDVAHARQLQPRLDEVAEFVPRGRLGDAGKGGGRGEGRGEGSAREVGRRHVSGGPLGERGRQSGTGGRDARTHPNARLRRVRGLPSSRPTRETKTTRLEGSMSSLGARLDARPRRGPLCPRARRCEPRKRSANLRALSAPITAQISKNARCHSHSDHYDRHHERARGRERLRGRRRCPLRGARRARGSLRGLRPRARHRRGGGG